MARDPPGDVGLRRPALGRRSDGAGSETRRLDRAPPDGTEQRTGFDAGHGHPPLEASDGVPTDVEHRALAVLVGLAAADPDERRTVALEREILDVEARHFGDAQQGVGSDADERRVAHAAGVAVRRPQPRAQHVLEAEDVQRQIAVALSSRDRSGPPDCRAANRRWRPGPSHRSSGASAQDSGKMSSSTPSNAPECRIALPVPVPGRPNGYCARLSPGEEDEMN